MKTFSFSLFTILLLCQCTRKARPTYYSNPIVTISIEDTLQKGYQIFAQQVSDPEHLIRASADSVLKKLYTLVELSSGNFQDIDTITLALKAFDGIAYKSGDPHHITVSFSTKYIAQKHKEEGMKADEILFELMGVLYHELTHGYQYSPNNAGGYASKTDHFSLVEGMADFVRIDLNQHKRPRKTGGHWNDGYTTTGYFLSYLQEINGDDFICRLNRSAQTLENWNWSDGLSWALNKEVSTEELWADYQAHIIEFEK
ncbi:MAG: basic secretory protein-like protein [Bacteroidales bacterium]|jgi:hypothetical protein|nr:basic secretory protein-like protein [Bacteroidales bacterium]